MPKLMTRDEFIRYAREATDYDALEFRAVVRKALQDAGIKCTKSYTDPAPQRAKGTRDRFVRYVAFDVGSSNQRIQPVVEAINKELTAQGFSTQATYLSYYIRGVCMRHA